eukprot:scaffold119651_cov17-Tisochrysis_lutea.AAC.1
MEHNPLAAPILHASHPSSQSFSIVRPCSVNEKCVYAHKYQDPTQSSQSSHDTSMALIKTSFKIGNYQQLVEHSPPHLITASPHNRCLYLILNHSNFFSCEAGACTSAITQR